MRLKPATKVHKATLESKENIWIEFTQPVADQIEAAQCRGRFMAYVKIHEDVTDAAPMVDELKALGYTASLMTGDTPRIIVSWRQPK